MKSISGISLFLFISCGCIAQSKTYQTFEQVWLGYFNQTRLTKPLNSHSFLWQHFHFMLEMIVAYRRAKGWRNKWRVLIGRPDDIDPRIRLSLERKFSFKQQDLTYSKPLLRYIGTQTVLTLFLLFIIILFEHYLSAAKLNMFSVFILLSVITTGSMLEQRRWIFHLEVTRLAVLGILIWLYFPYFNLIVLLLGLATIVLLFYQAIGRMYYSYLYK